MTKGGFAFLSGNTSRFLFLGKEIKMEQRAAVTFDLLKSINYAMQQNYIPVIRNLIVTNTGEDELSDLELNISFTPAFAQDFTVRLDKLLPGVPTEIAPVKIILSPELLFSLTEAMAGYVCVTLTADGKQVFFEAREVELLTYDQSVGLLSFPELISAFVTPNHPAVTGVLRSAAEYLAKWDGDPSFTAYQRQNPNSVKAQLAAVYAALQAENIAYAMPPAGYETSGQRVRLSDRVLNEKMGTCLDLSVLYASCLEAAGLNPMLIFTNGHAFCGCWLEELTFPECVTEDISALSKRIADGIDEICLIECTAFAAGKNVDFDEAISIAARNLSDPGPYFSIVDVHRCRGSKIRPIPVRVFENGVYKEADFGKRSEKDITAAPTEINMELHGASANKSSEVTKQTIWERRLLDLSLRNRLLNFRPGAVSVQLMTAGLAFLEDELAKSESFRIMPVPEDFTLHRSDTKMFEAESGTSAVNAIAESEFRNGRLRSYLNSGELEKVLKKLHRQAKVSLEENGANTLYLALGFLRWYETEKSEKPRLAPLVLIPVDITRKIQDRSYSIKMRDEEPQMNVTLLELLRQDFGINIGGLSPLPLDEHGVNIPLVFKTVRQGVMSMKRWDIVEEAFLGQFSFSRFIMWNDIRSRCDDLKANKVVSSLISGKMEWEPQTSALTAEELDRDIRPSDMAIVSSADSSQLSAVCEAARGSSFVLHGPPGTGKSQTITNMIANALYNKKTVLFVAEKMAALSVVQKRLEKIGLDPFCLELHSNKAQKRAVLSQLEKTLNVRRHAPSEDYKKVSDELFRQRSELNETVCALHKKQPHGRSLYELLTLYEQNISQKNKLSVSAELVKNMNESTFDSWLSSTRTFVLAASEAGGVSDSPFRYCNLKSYTTQLRDSFAERAAELCKNAEKAKNSFCSAFGAEPTGIAIVRACSRAASAVLSAEYPVEKAALDPDFAVRLPELERLIADGTALGALNAEISAEFDAAADNWNAGEAQLKWRAAEQKWALAKSMEQGKLLKELALYRKAGKPTAEQFLSACEKFAEKKRLSDSIAAAPAELTAYFGALWSGLQTDFERMGRCLKENAAINEILRPICSTPLASAIFAAARGNSEALGCFIADFDAYERTADGLAEIYKIDFTGVYGEAPCCFDAAMSQARLWMENIGALREHCALLSAKEQLDDMGLSCVTQALFNGNISCEELEAALCCAFGYTAANLAISEEPRLAGFRGTQFEAAIERFRELDSRFEELTIKELVAELSAKIPDISAGGASSSEIGILLKAIRSGGRNMSIRKLFDSIPNLLRRICPCMLMSPISVAQYIDPAYPKFDLVIFDEASQLPTCEAVGAIARGENVVVVGDPKQLPPTSFFTAEHTDEENAEIEDLESVLDDCLALAMPQKHLQWHYRSRHESLIAYSNAKFYDNSLMTFPSPDDIVSRVTWIPVEGYYDKGGSKQNKAEAQAIVDEIVRRLKDPVLRRESIGVVTFSLVQQVLIDDMLSDAFRNAPELEQLADGMYEPIFVKNLENVQGDERDVILFSVGYGPDKDGNVSMNFGPLNREGGWRRLNVAITRARKSMQVYSVITADQIDISRTASEGVAGLKGFLEFAQKGSSSLPVRMRSSESGTDDFAKLLSEEIRKMGYEVRCNIGCSGYKIDIGVINPDEPGAYILGIRCDNERYLSAGSARDRSVSQPGMLKGLGWNICSVWIMDYFDSPEKMLARIRTAIEDATEAYRNPPQIEKETPQAEQKEKSEAENKDEAVLPTALAGPIPYEEYDVSSLGSSEDFYTEKAFGDICSLCAAIIDAQAPISRDVLFKKLLGAYGINRSSAKAEAVLERAAGSVGLLATSGENGVFYWKAGTFPASYELCRVPAEGSEKRTLDEICPQEIANGVKIILSNQLSMTKSDLIRETAKLFGYTRLGGVMEACVSEGIDAAVRRGFVEINDERVSIKE